MAALSDFDAAVITYCAKNGVCLSSLARHFGKSRKWVSYLSKRDYNKAFPNEPSFLWFQAGIRAADLISRLKPWRPEEPATQLVTAKSDRYAELQESLKTWRLRQRMLLSARMRRLLPFFLPDGCSPAKHLCEGNDTEEEEDMGCEEEDDTEEYEDRDKGYEKEDDTERENEEEDVEPRNNHCLTDDSVPVGVSQSILENMMQNLSRRSRCSWRFNDDSVKFAYVVRSYSAVCYDYIRKVLPLPSRTLLSRKFGLFKKPLSETSHARNAWTRLFWDTSIGSLCRPTKNGCNAHSQLMPSVSISFRNKTNL